jgi:alkyl hydroperoxide reductase subunit AhpC
MCVKTLAGGGSLFSLATSLSQQAKGTNVALQLGDTAPDFTQESTEGPIHFYDWLGNSWGVLFSHPADFTPVCTTELGEAARLKPEFEETQGSALNFPLLADADRKVSTLYDLIHPNADSTATVRSVFVIDPNHKVRLILTYPASTGRNFTELLRTIDSLQLTDNFKVATPVNWKQGEDVIITTAVNDEEAQSRFPEGWKTLKPYLRFVKQPERETQKV